MNQNTFEQATLGGGCFWCLEAVFVRLQGVTQVVSGYAGGITAQPDYASVCSGTTGHAEVVQLTFDPSVVSYANVLDVFFAIHDPTTLNRQGHDVGTQYRSVIFTHSESQQTQARSMIDTLTREARYPNSIVTEVAPSPVFYPAEIEHQQYFARHPHQPYCIAVVQPKVAKFLRQFGDRARAD